MDVDEPGGGLVPDAISQRVARQFVEFEGTESIKAHGYECSAVVSTLPRGAPKEPQSKSVLIVFEDASAAGARRANAEAQKTGCVVMYEAAATQSGWAVQKAFASCLPLEMVRLPASHTAPPARSGNWHHMFISSTSST